MKDSYFITIYRNPDDEIFGVLLRADYTAEHETNGRTLLSALGDQCFNTKERSAVKVNLGLYDHSFVVRKGFVRGWKNGRKSKLSSLLLIGDGDSERSDFTPEIAFHDKPVNAGWDGSNFFISGRGSEGEALINLLRERAEAGDLFAFKGRSPVDADGGLGFLIESRTPHQVLVDLKKK